jgi:prolipoprotein diacylglyceryltransferase
MMAYAVGRIGCQIAGDGDWGIYNSAFKVDAANEVVVAAPRDFSDSVQAHSLFFLKSFESNESVNQAFFPKPGALSFLPNWFFAYNYPNNVNEAGIPLNGCEGRYCNGLPIPVFPTPMYETIGCTILFLLLWLLRKRIRVAGSLFCLYLFLNGMERFFIEQIRVNNKMNFLGMQPTQAEVIAVGLMLTGILGWIFLRTKYRATPQQL